MSADLEVFLQQLAVLALVGEPAAIPGAVDPEAQTDRVDLLTHYAVSSAWRTTIVRFENVCSRRADVAAATGHEALHDQAVADIGLGDDQRVGVEAVIVLGIGDGALERLLDRAGDALVREGELGERLVDLLAADHLRPRG